MKALILAAGFGTRMAPITDTIPKPLIPVLNRPVIEYNIYFLKSFGVSEIYINLHYNGEKIAKEIGNGSRYGVKIKYLREPDILGTGGAIASMEPFIDGKPFIVINSDTISDFNLDKMIEDHNKSENLATLGLIPATPKDKRAVIRAEGDKIVRMINESFYPELPEGNAVFTGVHIISPQLLEFIPKNMFVSITSYVYQRAIKSRRRLGAFYIKGSWWDMGTPDGYLDCTFSLFKNLPLKNYKDFDVFGREYVHTPYKNKENEDPETFADSFVALGNNSDFPLIDQLPPIVVGNNCEIKVAKSGTNRTGVNRIGPNLIIGDNVKLDIKLDGKNSLGNAVYLPEADGTRVIYGKNGKIYY